MKYNPCDRKFWCAHIKHNYIALPFLSGYYPKKMPGWGTLFFWKGALWQPQKGLNWNPACSSQKILTVSNFGSKCPCKFRKNLILTLIWRVRVAQTVACSPNELLDPLITCLGKTLSQFGAKWVDIFTKKIQIGTI